MEVIRALVVKHLQSIQKGIAENMEKQRRTASGRSVASLRIEEDANNAEAIRFFLTGGAQWAVMQQGRGPGKVPHNFSEIIREWIVKKGISYSNASGKTPEKKLNSLSYAIAYSIMKKGTVLHRNHGYNDIFDTLLREETEKLANESAGIMELDIDKINDSNNENS
jgi:hypothetical protein